MKDPKFTDKVEAPVERGMKTTLRERAFRESNEQNHRVSEAHIIRKALALYLGGFSMIRTVKGCRLET